MDILILILVFVILAIMVNVFLAKNGDDKQKKLQEEQERKKRIAEEKHGSYNSKIEELISTHGEITLDRALPYTGQFGGLELSSHLFIFEDTKVIVVNGEAIPFSKILAYSLVDNQQTIATTTGGSEIKTSTGSMVGRALVGGALFGGVGALAGATTAKKETEITTTTEHTTNHDYKIYLSINDIANPQRIIGFGKDEEAANKASSVFNIIISQNNK